MKSDPVQTDDERPPRRAQTKVRRWTILIGMGGLILIGLFAAIGYYATGGTDGSLGLFVCASVVFIVISLEVNAWRVRPLQAPTAREREWIRRHTDRVQSVRSYRLLWSALITLLATPFVWLVTGEILAGKAGVGDDVLMFAWFSLAAFNLSTIDGRTPYKALKPAYEDEFSQALRSRALMIGFQVLSFGVVWVFIMAAMGRPALAIGHLPLVLTGSYAAATGAFAVMDLRAGRGE